MPRWLSTTSLALSLLAVGLSAYLTVTHYSDPAALACPDTGIINCTAVTTSSWSVLFGVPVALIGLLWAVGMAGVNLPWVWRARAAWLDRLRVGLSGAGALMILYLLYLELFRVDAICLWCTGVHVTAVTLFAVILAGHASMASRHAAPHTGRSAAG